MARPTVGGFGLTLLSFSVVGLGVVSGSAALAQQARVELQLGARGGLDEATVAVAQETAGALLAAAASTWHGATVEARTIARKVLTRSC